MDDVDRIAREVLAEFTSKKQRQEALQLATIRKRPLARLLGVSAWSIDRWRKLGQFPEPIWLGPSTPVWRISDVDAWMTKRKGKQQ